MPVHRILSYVTQVTGNTKHSFETYYIFHSNPPCKAISNSILKVSFVPMSSNPDGTIQGRGSFRRAKIVHYLDRAEEYMKMARYSTARRTIETVYTLDPGNNTGRILEQALRDRMATLATHAVLSGSNGNGHGLLSTQQPQKKIVLLVDQDERVLLTLSEYLLNNKYEVISAGSYSEALETLSNVQPDIIISEVNFENGPVGFDLYLHTRSNAKTLDVPFLFLATRIDRDLLIAGKRLGVDDFLSKPLDREVVVASIWNCLSRKTAVVNRN